MLDFIKNELIPLIFGVLILGGIVWFLAFLLASFCNYFDLDPFGLKYYDYLQSLPEKEQCLELYKDSQYGDISVKCIKYFK